ncbi:MAG: hypothetical protein IKY90_10615 [Oscillospiraceae bacterium]|nr:hypothetical protein [Oscillospiraceae bacterium]
MIKKLLSLSATAVLLLSLAVSLSVNCGCKAVDYIRETNARKSGQLQEITLSDADFELSSMKKHPSENGLVATDGDPFIIYSCNMLLSGVSFRMEYSMYPADMLLYWTTATQTEYSNSNMAVITPAKDEEGLFYVSVPLTEVTGIRIDPTTVAGNHLVFSDFVINPEKTLSEYLTFDSYSLMAVGIYTLVLFAVIRFVQDFFTKKQK